MILIDTFYFWFICLLEVLQSIRFSLSMAIFSRQFFFFLLYVLEIILVTSVNRFSVIKSEKDAAFTCTLLGFVFSRLSILVMKRNFNFLEYIIFALLKYETKPLKYKRNYFYTNQIYTKFVYYERIPNFLCAKFVWKSISTILTRYKFRTYYIYHW